MLKGQRGLLVMKYLFNRYNLKTWILFILSAIAACIVLPDLPEIIPTHFNMSGEVDGYGSRYMIFLAPVTILICQVLAEVCRAIDPKKENYDKFKKYYYQLFFGIGLIMLVMQGVTIAAAFGRNPHVDTIMPVMLGILFIFIGNMMPKFEHNFMAGIKTSWTLANEQVWKETHRFGGKVWMIGGFLSILTVLLPAFWRFIAFLAVVIIITIIPIVFSYIRYKKI